MKNDKITIIKISPLGNVQKITTNNTLLNAWMNAINANKIAFKSNNNKYILKKS